MGIQMPRALLVEDSSENRQLVTWILEDADYDIDEAENAEDGISILKDHSVDVALMDISLPGMSGDSAIQYIRTELGLVDLPIIALTGHTLEEDHAKFKASGATVILTKPIDEDLLLETLSSLVSV
ncbi:MAG: response regulator [Agarilytica sp.]